MKKILLIFLLIVNSIGYTQKLKVKKDQIFLDDNPIANINTKLGFYRISNLDGSNPIVAYSLTGKFIFLQIKNEATGRTNEMDFEKFSAFNVEGSAVKTLFSKQFLTEKGVDIDKINAFLEGESSGLLQKYGYISPETIKAEQDLAATYKIKIDDAGVIYQKTSDNKDEIIGKIKMSLANNYPGKYEVVGTDNYLVATWFSVNVHEMTKTKFLDDEIVTFDNRIFKVKYDTFGNQNGTLYRLSTDANAINVVKKLLMNGYNLKRQGSQVFNQAKNEQLNQTIAAIKSEKLSSNNIYDQTGFIIDEKGEKREGTITTEFESIKAESSNGMADMTAYGKTAILKFTNEKGKTKSDSYKSKNGIKFCIDKSGSQECYLGLKTIGNSGAIGGSLNSLSFDFSSYYKIIYEDNGYLLLVDPINAADFIIKTPNQEKGLYTNKSNFEKLKKNFIEYVNCKDFIFENFDFKTQESLIKVLNELKTKCKN